MTRRAVKRQTPRSKSKGGEHVSDKDQERAELEALLAERLKLAEDPNYEGELLSRRDHLVLFTVGIIVPVILLIIGWVTR
jgi:hypothetical protein